MAGIRRIPEEVISVGGPVDEARPTLCIYGDDLEPHEITKLLGCAPSRSHRRGEALGPRGVVARTGAWLLESVRTGSGDLEAQILELLTRVSPDLHAWQQLSRRYTTRMSCMLELREWSRGLGLTTDVLGRLSERGIGLDFSIYYVGDDDA